MDREINQGQGRRLTPEERAERVRKLKKKRRLRLAIVISAFVLILAVIISPIILFAAFRVKTFAVEGTSPYVKEEIVAASEIELGKSLIFIDVDKVAAAIEKNLPYTDDVVITKKLPSSIVIRYGETTKAFAFELNAGTYALTDSNLKVLELSATVPEGITLIQGAIPVSAETGTIMSFTDKNEVKDDETSKDRTLELVLGITKAIAENGMEDINFIDISARNDIYMIYQERMVLSIGDSSDINAKLSLGQRVIVDENKIDPSQFATIDLTIAKKAYVNPSDPEDIKELVIYNGGEWKEPEVEAEINESDDENHKYED